MTSTNPTVAFSRWFEKTKKATPATQMNFPLYGVGNINDALSGHADLYGESATNPHLISVAEWKGAHDRESFNGASGVMFEYDSLSEHDVRDMAARLELAHTIIETGRKHQETVTVIFWFDEPEYDPKAVSRVAAILSGLLKVYRLQKGSDAVTFFVAARPFGKVEFVDGDLINVPETIHQFSDFYTKSEWYECPPPVAKASVLPLAIQQLQARAAANRAQLNPPVNSDLFPGLN